MGGYRYGFNGQEHSSEVGGNNYTAQFWEYDSRIGRRWNIDAVYKHSPYEAFASNPIIYPDPSGLDTINFNRRVTTFYPKGGGRPTGTSSFDITRVRSGGADVFMYNQTNTVIDSRGGNTTTTHTVLHPEDPESANGMTYGLNLYFDGLVTTQRKNYDWESIGKLMYANQGFKNFMLSRNPKSAQWMSNASSMEDMEGVMPTAVSSGISSWIGARFLATNVAASGAIVYGKADDPFIVWAQRAAPNGEYLDVVMYGSPRAVWYNPDMMIDHRILANLIRRNPQFTGQPIRLLSCNTGRLADGFAKNLSNALGVEVRAPEDIIWAFPDGKLSIGPTYLGGKSFVNFSQGIKKREIWIII